MSAVIAFAQHPLGGAPPASEGYNKRLLLSYPILLLLFTYYPSSSDSLISFSCSFLLQFRTWNIFCSLQLEKK